MANRRGHAGKVDFVQGPIVEALRAAGVFVQSLAGVGDGCPDLLCSVRGAQPFGGVWGAWFLIECKQEGERLTPHQKAWHASAPAATHVAYSPEQALQIAEFYRQRKGKNG